MAMHFGIGYKVTEVAAYAFLVNDGASTLAILILDSRNAPFFQ